MQDIYRPIQESRPYAALELENTHPNLLFRNFSWIDDPRKHLVIDDISAKFVGLEVKAAVAMAEALCRGGIKIYEMDDLVRNLYVELSPFLESRNPAKTLLVFPGEGAQTVKDCMPQDVIARFPWITLEAHRIKDSQGEVLGIDLSNVQELLDALGGSDAIEDVIVIDDVIDTGSTLNAIRQAAEADHLSWFAAAPIVYSPLIYPDRKSFPSSIEGYEKVFAAEVIQGVNNPTPLNSLTSFVEGGEKTDRLVKKCLDLFVAPEDAQAFLDTLFRLHGVLVYN